MTTMSLSKKDLIPIFIQQLESDLAAITEAARSTLDAATNEESKAENQYDTRALEAGYLAGAQAKRVQELKDVLGIFNNLTFKDFNNSDAVQSTAIVEVLLDGKQNTLLIMPKGGGVQLKHDGKLIQVVTPASHLGEAILGLNAGDSIDFEVGNKTRTCEIINVF